MRTTHLLTASALGGLLALAAGPPRDATAARDLAAAARAFLGALGPELAAKATLPMDGDERRNWNFVPGRYPGVELGAMDVAARRAAHDLLRAVLSARGYLTATAVFALDGVLRDLEVARGRDGAHRDPERYAFAVFCTPGTTPGDGAPWGCRVQGHHVSINVTVVGGVVRATPLFLGANPAEVRTGPLTGLRVLGAEEDLARALLASLGDAQRERVLLDAKAPADIILGPGRAFDLLGPPKGVACAAMNDAQRVLLRALVADYAELLRAPFAQDELARIDAAGFDAVCFAWAGGTARGEPHYFRVHGPGFVIEYDNTQHDANHVHTVWHDLTDDFGDDALKRHYAEHK